VRTEAINVRGEFGEVVIGTGGSGAKKVVKEVPVLVLLCQGLFFFRPGVPDVGEVIELVDSE
jgi:hypothetical protein